MEVAEFIARWSPSGAAERANKDAFLIDLCAAIGVPGPEPTTGDRDRDVYVFEKDAVLVHEDKTTSVGKMDLFKKECFILEAKQGSEEGSKKLGTARRGTAAWNIAMTDALGQAIGYAQTLDSPPPFLIVCDLGYCFDIYATFDGSTVYRPFPNARARRVFLKDLAEHRQLLRSIFLDPRSLDPSLKASKVTREVAGYLADLAKHLEADGHDSHLVAQFLMRCIFTMFAEDIGLLEKNLFTDALQERWIEKPEVFAREVESMWKIMNTGGELFGHGHLPQFNGGLFASSHALRLEKKHLQILLLASLQDWKEVEPAIFGTLLERALDPKERHRLGAHFTPRAYVERLVRPTIEEPLRAEWDVVKAQVRQLVANAEPEAPPRPGQRAPKIDPLIVQAREAVKAFHKRICALRVLDPACGTGNFLYVALDLFKRLEGEVMLLLRDLGVTGELLALEGVRITPAQFLGIEVKPWAKEIADLVLWIGYIQWHYRTPGREALPPEPILRNYGNIEERDAVLAWDGEPELVRDPTTGVPVTRWDGVTYKKSPVTGEDIPDDGARVETYRYKNPRRAEWPNADFVVGNPPFVGNKLMRGDLGDGYVEALRAVHDDLPDTIDFVMYWWDHAAKLLRSGALQRFGLITTKTITQPFNRKVVGQHLGAKDGISLTFAVPNHPWVDSVDGAAVRIAMTVASPGTRKEGLLARVSKEVPIDADDVQVELVLRAGYIHENLAVGADVAGTVPLRANTGLCTQGVKLVGDGFLLTETETPAFAGPDGIVKPFISNKDLVQKSRRLSVIDFHGHDDEQARIKHPMAFQHLFDTVRLFRMENRDPQRRRNWWLFGRSNEQMRASLSGLLRYIVTPEVATHRPFAFVNGSTVPDASLYVVGADDALILGVLSSKVHVKWAIAAGGWMGVGNDPRYQNGSCFDPFPFPATTDVQSARIGKLGDALDAHRKRRQSEHPQLTITGMYNVVEKLRAGEELTDKDKAIHEQGLVSILRQIHDDLDAAVLDAYGWPRDIADDEIIDRLVKLNAERAAEEAKGLIRWLRPEFQIPRSKKTKAPEQMSIGGEPAEEEAATPSVTPWPDKTRLPERIAAVRDMVMAPGTWSAKNVAKQFKRAPEKEVATILDSLAALGLLVGFDTPEGRRWRVALRVVS